MTGETEATTVEVVASCFWFDPCPSFLLTVQDFSTFAASWATVAGAVFIPLILYWNEKKRATLDLIRYLGTDDALHVRTNRIFQFRMHRAGKPGYKNPYEQDPTTTASHDLGLILNAYDTACTEIKFGAVYETMLFEAVKDTIIAAEHLLRDLEDITGQSQTAFFPYLIEQIAKWKQKAARLNKIIAPPISPDKPARPK